MAYQLNAILSTFFNTCLNAALFVVKTIKDIEIEDLLLVGIGMKFRPTTKGNLAVLQGVKRLILNMPSTTTSFHDGFNCLFG